jgi:hypothetical protein
VAARSADAGRDAAGALKDLAGGNRDLELEGATVRDVLGGKRISDEAVRASWQVGVGASASPYGERVDGATVLRADDHLQVLPSITGGT